MSASIPTDLRVICRKLVSIDAQQLPHSLPSLVNHVLRCKQVLAAPHDAKAKGDKSESAVLVHKLMASITTLLNSRVKEARFAAIALVKAAVDVGGWEVLRGTGPWVNGLLSIVQVCSEQFLGCMGGNNGEKLTQYRKEILRPPRNSPWSLLQAYTSSFIHIRLS